jgi:hypothetical protein
MNNTPTFKHDCNNCVFLGGITAGGRLADLYYCDGEVARPTVIARYSDDGPDYSSGLAFGDLDMAGEIVAGTGHIAELVVARELAIRADYINREGKIQSIDQRVEKIRRLASLT